MSGVCERKEKSGVCTVCGMGNGAWLSDHCSGPSVESLCSFCSLCAGCVGGVHAVVGVCVVGLLLAGEIVLDSE